MIAVSVSAIQNCVIVCVCSCAHPPVSSCQEERYQKVSRWDLCLRPRHRGPSGIDTCVIYTFLVAYY